MSDPEYIGRIARSIAMRAGLRPVRQAVLRGCRESTDADFLTCRQRTCCREKGFSGCWECRFFPAGRACFLCAEQSSEPYRLCALGAEDGADALASYLAANEAQAY
ncbi:MAG: DUF3795 domain-containing protein [Ruthenibacterium lactatiformans]